MVKYNILYNYIGDIMDKAIVTARKWGNSIGVALPSDIVEKEKIGANDQLVISVQKVVSIKDLFGTFKSKRSTQEIMDEVRKGWNE